MKMAELSRRSGVLSATIYKMLRGGQTASLSHIWNLAKGLEVRPDQLLPIDGPELSPYEAAVVAALRDGDPVALATALDDAGAELRPALTSAEQRTIDAARAGDADQAVEALAEVLGVPLHRLTVRPNPSAPVPRVEALAEVGRRAEQLGAAIRTALAVEPDQG